MVPTLLAICEHFVLDEAKFVIGPLDLKSVARMVGKADRERAPFIVLALELLMAMVAMLNAGDGFQMCGACGQLAPFQLSQLEAKKLIRCNRCFKLTSVCWTSWGRQRGWEGVLELAKSIYESVRK